MFGWLKRKDREHYKNNAARVIREREANKRALEVSSSRENNLTNDIYTAMMIHTIANSNSDSHKSSDSSSNHSSYDSGSSYSSSDYGSSSSSYSSDSGSSYSGGGDSGGGF